MQISLMLLLRYRTDSPKQSSHSGAEEYEISVGIECTKLNCPTTAYK